ncbi:ParA family protein [Ferviditalea candida]|uniref:ParA family protein n=1 Tax=Ferviditalea candida TaxID=3108399 RepID=A0ABU5ZJZ3_9BACL|nr:ParA family protein [Paenibacillaceae bacterium T2]
MSKKPVKYAVFNNKGGVGKSTLAVHIAHGLALEGYKVLLLDMDGQNDASLFLGFTSEDYKWTLYDVICGRQRVDLRECVIHARNNLDLLPSTQVDLINLEFYRESRIDLVLNEKLKPLEELGYQFVIIDCGPQRTKVNDAVLCYADGLIVPVQLQAASVRAIGNIYEYLADMRLDADLIKLVVPNMLDQRTNDSRENMEILKEFIANDDLLAAPVFRRTKIAEAGKLGKTVFEYDNESAQQFESVAKRVISIHGSGE